MGQRCCGAALLGLCRGAAAILGLPGFPRAHALLLGALVGLGPLLRGRGDPHSLLASPHNRLEARLTASAAAWTWLLIGSLLVASHPWLRPPWGSALRALTRLAVGLALSRLGHALGHALEAATGSCQSETALGTLLLPLGDPASCRGAGHTWEGFGPAPQAFALVHCGLGLAEEAAALGRSLYGGKMAAGGKMASGYEVGGEESKMAARFKMAAGYEAGEEESKMAARFKMAAGYEAGEEESKMAAGYYVEESKMAPRFKMAAGYGEGREEGSKMAARFKMAAPYDVGEEGAKMAAGHKMAAGYDVTEGSKMAAGRGWAWPRLSWRPIGFEWAGPSFGQPSWGRGGSHFDSGGHFEMRGGHFDSGGHFESPHSRHLDPHSRHLEPRGRHFDSPYGGHLEHHTRHFNPPGGHFDPSSRHFNPPSRHFDPQGSHFNPSGGHFDPQGGHFNPPSRHFDPRGGHFDPRTPHFFTSRRHIGVGHLAGGHLEAPPCALSVLYLLGVALLLTWHLLLVATLTYRNTWARNAAGAALGWACWVLTYRGWYRWAWSPGPPGWG